MSKGISHIEALDLLHVFSEAPQASHAQANHFFRLQARDCEKKGREEGREAEAGREAEGGREEGGTKKKSIDTSLSSLPV